MEKSSDGKSAEITAVLSLVNAGESVQTIRYTVYGGGEIGIEAMLDVNATADGMSRYGLMLTLPASYEQTLWYGYGGQEGFVDRMRANIPGVYASTVTDNFYPYGKPQDTGNMMGVRWYALTSETMNTGLLAVSDSMEAQALHFSADKLQSTKFTYRLPKNPEYTYLTLSYMSRGTGGESCGPGPLAQYLIPTEETLTFTVTLVPFAKGADANELTDLSRLWRDSQSLGDREIDALLAGRVDQAIRELLFDSSDIQAVRTAYDGLTAAQKALVSSYGILTYLEDQVGQACFVRDISGNGRDVAAASSAVFADEGSPSGYLFCGKFPIPDEDGLINATLSGESHFTISAWVKLADTNSHNIIFAKGDSQVALKTNLGGELEFFVYENGWVAITAKITARRWTFVTAVRDGEGLKLYVDGVLAAERAYTGNVRANGVAPGVGVDLQSDRSFRGLMAGIQIYSRALNAEEIRSLNPNAVTDGAVVAYDFSDSSK